MGKLTEEVFNESCCDGGICDVSGQSAQSCGCDPGANYVSPNCWIHKNKFIQGVEGIPSSQFEQNPLDIPKPIFLTGLSISSEVKVAEHKEKGTALFNGIDENDLQDVLGSIRTFESGATRDLDISKFDYEGFESPLVMERFAEFMHSNRMQKDGNLRDSDNWQKGIPKEAYMKSMWRHLIDVWLHHRGWGSKAKEPLEVALCALRFNVSGYLFEVLKEKESSS